MAEALGMIECRSFAAMVEAADAMVKAAKVELVSYEKTGGGYVTAIIRGDVAAVKAAVDAGQNGAARVGDIVTTHIIARPHVNVDLVLPLRQVNPENLKEGGFVVANDAVGCGIGEFVLYASGSSARQTEVTKDRPCDAVIMAIVDTWEIGGQTLFDKNSSEHGYKGA